MEFVLATANPHKTHEIRDILGDADVQLLDRPQDVPEVEENGATLEDNARLKARALMLATGKAAIADDTGLEVDALDGRPGVYAARYAGESASYEDNQNKLLDELAGVDLEGRTARFLTVAMVVFPDGTEIWETGVVEGHIAEECRGDGWGYDPVFVPADGDGRTFAEMPDELKNSISHRARAFLQLKTRLLA